MRVLVPLHFVPRLREKAIYTRGSKRSRALRKRINFSMKEVSASPRRRNQLSLLALLLFARNDINSFREGRSFVQGWINEINRYTRRMSRNFNQVFASKRIEVERSCFDPMEDSNSCRFLRDRPNGKSGQPRQRSVRSLVFRFNRIP